MEFTWTWVENGITKTMHLTLFSLIGLIIFVGVILAIIGYGLFMTFSPVKIRNIKVVKRRKNLRDLPYDPKTHTGSDSYYTLKTTTLDFVYLGKKHVHTWFCDEWLLKKLHPGHTYKVKMKYPHILSIVEKIPMDKSEQK